MAEKLHRLSNVGGAPRRNSKAAIDSVAEYSSATERGMRVLMEAQNYWNSMDQFRRDRQRNKNYTYGRQWDDVICVDGHRMREEDYIKSQGNVALKTTLSARWCAPSSDSSRHRHSLPSASLATAMSSNSERP